MFTSNASSHNAPSGRARRPAAGGTATAPSSRNSTVIAWPQASRSTTPIAPAEWYRNRSRAGRDRFGRGNGASRIGRHGASFRPAPVIAVTVAVPTCRAIGHASDRGRGRGRASRLRRRGLRSRPSRRPTSDADRSSLPGDPLAPAAGLARSRRSTAALRCALPRALAARRPLRSLRSLDRSTSCWTLARSRTYRSTLGALPARALGPLDGAAAPSARRAAVGHRTNCRAVAALVMRTMTAARCRGPGHELRPASMALATSKGIRNLRITVLQTYRLHESLGGDCASVDEPLLNRDGSLSFRGFGRLGVPGATRQRRSDLGRPGDGLQDPRRRAAAADVGQARQLLRRRTWAWRASARRAP